MPRITYNDIDIDIPIGPDGLMIGSRQFGSINYSAAGLFKEVCEYGIDALKLDIRFQEAEYRQLYNFWWQWARHRRMFALALNSSDMGNVIILPNYTDDVNNCLGDPDFSLTTSPTDYVYWKWDQSGDGEWGSAHGCSNTPGYRLFGAASSIVRAQESGARQYIPATNEDTIYFKLKVKKDSLLDGDHRFLIWEFDSGKNYIAIRWASFSSQITVSDTWVVVSGSLAVIDADAAYVGVGIYVNGATQGNLYLDDVYIGKTAPVSSSWTSAGQKIIPVIDTYDFSVGDQILIRSSTTTDRERHQIASIQSAENTITTEKDLVNDFYVNDIVRHANYYPYLICTDEEFQPDRTGEWYEHVFEMIEAFTDS